MIDYLKLAVAMNFYKQRGYKHIEASWTASYKAMMITAPSADHIVRLEGDRTPLVGSSEQSFLDLVLKKQLNPGQYVACTPCFRNEERIDKLHQSYFMKVELFKNDRVSEEALREMMNNAIMFFNTYTDAELVKTDIGYDIVSKGIELGSYGIREHPLTGPWIYGTGCAEPRLSTVMAM